MILFSVFVFAVKRLVRVFFLISPALPGVDNFLSYYNQQGDLLAVLEKITLLTYSNFFTGKMAQIQDVLCLILPGIRLPHPFPFLLNEALACTAQSLSTIRKMAELITRGIIDYLSE